jgi:hypothetical protein
MPDKAALCGYLCSWYVGMSNSRVKSIACLKQVRFVACKVEKVWFFHAAFGKYFLRDVHLALVILAF